MHGSEFLDFPHCAWVIIHLSNFREINLLSTQLHFHVIVFPGQSKFLGFLHCKAATSYVQPLYHSVVIKEIYSHSFFWQKFRESKIFTKEITQELIKHNIFLVRL